MTKKTIELTHINMGGVEVIFLEDLVLQMAKRLGKKPIIKHTGKPLAYCVSASRYLLIEKYKTVEKALRLMLSP